MVTLFHKHKLLFTIAGVFFILVIVIALASYFQSRTEASSRELSTPELIDQAYNRGQITEEEHLLYFAYAIYEYESLPTRLLGSVEWDGTPILEVIQETVTSPEEFCSMSLYVQNELRRVLPNKVATCD